MANPYDNIPTRSNGTIIQATWFNTIKESLVNNGSVKHKIDATTAPTTSNDNTENYEAGSTWADTTNDNFYVCVDASTSAAVWYEVADTTTSQTLTNKTLTAPSINGSNLNFGTASNSNRLLLPSDTTTNLDALTDVAGLIAYDTTLSNLSFNNGSGWSEIRTITPWASYTPTFNSGFTVGTGGDALSLFDYRRIGDSIEIRGQVCFGTSGASIGSGAFTFTLPSGLSMPSSFYNLSGYAGFRTLTVSRLGDTSLATTYSGHVLVNNAGDPTKEFFISPLGTYGVATATVPFTWAASDFISIPSFTVPINGW